VDALQGGDYNADREREQEQTCPPGPARHMVPQQAARHVCVPRVPVTAPEA
jgi:hypothetical protein